MWDVMRKYQLVLCFFLCLLVSLLVSGMIVKAESSDQVEGFFTIEPENGVSFSVIFSGSVEKITLSASGKTYTSNEIEDISNTNPEVMGAIKYAVMTKISDQLHQSFPNTIISSKTELPQYENQLFLDEYSIMLTSRFFGMNQTIDASDLVSGLLDVGAIVNYSFPLTANNGWNNVYTFVLPETMNYKRTTGKVSGKEIHWEVMNNDGEHPTKTAEISFVYTSPTSSSKGNETISVLFEIDASSGDHTSLNANFSAQYIDLSDFQIMPSFISNGFILPSDAVRLCVLNNLTNWDQIKMNTFVPLNNQIISLLETPRFNQTLDMIFSWDNSTTSELDQPYNVTHMDSIPPVIGVFTDTQIDLQICKTSSKAVFGLVNAGANVSISSDDVNIGENLNQLEIPFQGALILPDHVLLNGEKRYTWDKNGSINGSFSSDVAKKYQASQINSDVVIEVKNTDLNLLSFFTGKTELTIGVHCEKKEYRNVSSVPSVFTLPNKINIDFLNADAFRLCIEESVFSPNEISSFLSMEKNEFNNLSKTIIPTLKGSPQVDEDLFWDSLQWDENISTMSDKNPIQIVSYIHSSYPLSFQFSFFPPDFNIQIQNLTFTGIPDENVTYTMIFPAGISVVANDSLNRVQTKMVNGKTMMTISFNNSEGNLIDVVSIELHPTAFYILGLFVPCIVSVIITIILFIVVYVIRKKRNQIRGSRPPQNPSEEEPYQDQEYYVPPPPSNKR